MKYNNKFYWSVHKAVQVMLWRVSQLIASQPTPYLLSDTLVMEPHTLQRQTTPVPKWP